METAAVSWEVDDKTIEPDPPSITFPQHTHAHSECERLPVQPGQQTLGSCDQLDDGCQESVGGLMGNLVMVSRILPALRNGPAQVMMRCSHLSHNSL